MNTSTHAHTAAGVSHVRSIIIKQRRRHLCYTVSLSLSQLLRITVIECINAARGRVKAAAEPRRNTQQYLHTGSTTTTGCAISDQPRIELDNDGLI